MKAFSMKANLLLASICLAVFTFNSCSKAPIENINESNTPITLETNAQALKSRTSNAKAGLISLTNQSSGNNLVARVNGRSSLGNMATMSGESSPSSNAEIYLALVKEILPPTINGTLVRVTHIAIAGNYAYVGYNREGDEYAGAIDVIDISDIDNPRLVSSAGIPNMDISAVFVEGDRLHFAGSADVDIVENITTPAVSGIIPLAGGTPTANYFLESFQGTTVTDLVLNQGFKYIVSGSYGEIAKIDKSTNQVVKRVSAPGLLSVRTNDNHVIALSADNGLLVFDKDLNQIKTLQTLKNNVVHKRNIEVDNNYAFVSEGVSGLGIYELQSGNLIDRIPVPAGSIDFPFVDPEELTTISLSFSNNRAFIANGAAGFSVYKQGDNPSQLSYLGAADLNIIGESSSNYILVQDNYVFVAGGKGGLKILKLTDLTESQPASCSGNFPKFEGNTTYDFNTNQTNYSFADSKNFSSGINIGAKFIWCGSLESEDINVNSGGEFNMTGSLVVRNTLHVNQTMTLNGSAAIHKGLSVNSNGILSINGSLAYGTANNSNTLHVNGKIKLEGEIVVYGNLQINSGGSIEFIGDSKITVYGNLTNWGSADSSKIVVIN